MAVLRPRQYTPGSWLAGGGSRWMVAGMGVVPSLRWRTVMPEKATVARARADKRAGKAPTTQAGEFVREEIHHVREGKHGARSTKQAIAIGLSKARRSGVRIPRKGAAARRKTRRTRK